jgi:glycerol uptake facilitator-like aquaporin
MSFDLSRRLAAEALGTFFLVMAVVGSGIMAEKLAGGNEAIALLCNTLPTGAVLFVIITIFVSEHLPRHFSSAGYLKRE